LSRRPCTFRESDLRRALRAAAAARVDVRIEIEPGGKLVVVTNTNKEAATVTSSGTTNPWDDV
jgi:hypothetical protein